MTNWKTHTHIHTLSLEELKTDLIKYSSFTLQITEYYGITGEYTNLLRHLDFYVMPVVNVDGYDYSWKKVGEKAKKTNHALLGDIGYTGWIIQRSLDLSTMALLLHF